MSTTFHLISGKQSESYPDFKLRIFGILERIEQIAEIDQLKVTLTEEKPPAISIIPFGKDKIAAIRINGKEEVPAIGLETEDGYINSYVVEEALPVSYDRIWENRVKTPGVCLLTLFRKKRSISIDSFIDRWYHGHTPLSLDIHPLWHYSRNEVKRALDTKEVWYDGIVEEHCRTRGELLNPIKFFGGPIAMISNMVRVYLDVRSFLDYSSIRPCLVSEYYFKE